MKELPKSARRYILATLVVATPALLIHFRSFILSEIWLVLTLCLIASITQIFKVEGSTERSSYNLSWIVYGFALVHFGVTETLIVIIASHCVEWVWHKYPWYIQAFNIASYIIVTIFSAIPQTVLTTWVPNKSTMSIAAILSTLVAFTFLNHVLIGYVIKFARGQGFNESGVLNFFPLMLDFALLCMGAASAFIWLINPMAVVLSIIPLYLIYSTLQVPSLQRKTDIDAKTGLFNSRFFSQALERELARSIRFDRPMTIIMADMDLLRNINNTYGHLAGDEVLIGVANILKSNFREYDIVSRFGGEEFAILMPETSVKQAIQKAEEIRASIEHMDFEISTSIEPIKVTMSFGIAEREGFEQSKDQLIHNADKALYRAKLTGRNKVLLHEYGSNGFNDREKVLARPSVSPEVGEPKANEEVGIQAATTISEGAEADQSNAAEAETPQNTNSKVQGHSRWKLNLFIGALAFVSFALLSLLLSVDFKLEWYGLITFTLLAIIAEALSLNIYVKTTSVSTSAVPFIAGLLLYGPISAGVIGLSIAIVAWVKHHSPIHRLIFNISNHVMGGLVSSGILLLCADRIPSEFNIIAQFLLGLILGGILFFSTTGLISVAISLDKSAKLSIVWNQNFRWLSTTYLAMGALGFCLMLSFEYGGILGVVSIIAPLMILRLSQYQYLERTKELVNNLRSSNQDLAVSSKLINDLNEELLGTLAEVIDLRDPFVLGHSQHVAGNASRMAKELGLSTDQIDAIYKAGLLHDIGKIGVPEEILQKPGKLSEFEMEQVKKHPTIGADLVGKCHSLGRVVPIIRHHHEKFNGTGYPDGLRGTDIPIEARILALADVVEALSSDRPYRAALKPEDVLKEVTKMSGEHFDPDVVAVFLKLAKSEKSLIFHNSAVSTKKRILGNTESIEPYPPDSIKHPLPL